MDIKSGTRRKRKTGIKSLKIGFNKVFGYYLEITKSNLHLTLNIISENRHYQMPNVLLPRTQRVGSTGLRC